MRKSLLAAVSAAALLAGISLANASDVTGTIRSVHAKTGLITLDNGKVYKLPMSIKATDWKVGEKVKVTFDSKDGQLTVTSISKA